MYEDGPKCNVKLCSDNAVPSASVVRNCLGSSLAKVFFEYTHRDTTSLLNVLTPPQRSRTCFSIPSDVHLDQSETAPPTDHQITKAFVHQNILEIGEALLEEVKKQIEESLREKIERQSREKFYLYQAKKRREAEVYAEKLHEKYQDYIETVRHVLQEQLEVEWSKAAAECAKNTQKAVVQERINVVNEMMPKMRAEMTYAIQSLYKEFNEIFCAQRDKIIADFNQIMRDKHVKLQEEMREFRETVSRDLHIQRRQYEMQNAADVIYVLCMERLRSSKEKHVMHKYFQQQVEEFYKLIIRLRDVVNLMREEILDCHIEKKLLEEQLSKVIKHFQKFINFVFRAMPGHANYLLPLELQRLIRRDNDEEDKTNNEEPNKGQQRKS
ncbi:uncharacterized protein C6orf163 homolog [Ceratina calcarata]|uniref:Uncharacterized protein C6orf163 homolog n=1 Tax=Ceratina calcarata TaxID=156304 RepID=A0AAJ7SC44_9HYME|nr:uncharacterized protein C6orf163 homolog [Ceratina calcarata]